MTRLGSKFRVFLVFHLYLIALLPDKMYFLLPGPSSEKRHYRVHQQLRPDPEATIQEASSGQKGISRFGQAGGGEPGTFFLFSRRSSVEIPSSFQPLRFRGSFTAMA
jgi:hypothetical protein